MDDCRRAEWEKLDITKDELNRLGNALKNEEFRKLLVEYAEEINDPANKKIYEDEIKQLEKERGVDCTFINPEPGYVIKTSIDGKKKAFINVCMNDHIGKPTSAPSKSSSGARGLTWSLPYSQVAPHEDLDKKSVRCTVFDVVFHSDTHRLAANNPQFKNMLNNTALDAVEENYHVKLDRKNVRFPKMAYKGLSRPSVIRKKSSNPPSPSSDEDLPYPPAFNYPLKDLPTEPQTIPKTDSPKKVQDKQDKDTSKYTTPKYNIKYRDSVDIQDWTNDKASKMNAVIPKELVISVFLPLLKTTADVELDVHEKWIELKSTKIAKYFLHVALPYPVDDQSGNAKFDLSERKLVITLPVKRTTPRVDLNREDSGIESDAGIHSPETEEVYLTEERSSKIQVLSEFACDVPNRTCSDALDSGAKSEHFLNPDLHFSPTTYTCNVHENIMAFTLHVKNVEPDSVQYVSRDANVLHLRFSSIGAGFFPVHYAFFLKLTSGFTFVEDEVSVEAWDNNVIVQLALNPTDSLMTNYFVGIDEATATIQELSEPTAIGQKLALTAIEDVPSGLDVEVTKNSEEEVVIEISQKEEKKNPDSQEDQKEAPSAKPIKKKDVEKARSVSESEKARSYSESSGEEQGSSFTLKGILKCRSVSRSLSESNVDDFSSTSSLDPFPESFGSDLFVLEEGMEEEQAARKTARVRFNEVIAKQTFRMNSSILGQRKKNQRKTLSKRRAQERRASESEKEDFEKESNNAEDKLSSSSDETNDKPSTIPPPSTQSDAKNIDEGSENVGKKKNKSRKKKAGQNKHTAVKTDQLGFKNDLIFDLDL